MRPKCRGRTKTRPVGRRKSRPVELGEMGFAGRGGWSENLRSGLPDRVQAGAEDAPSLRRLLQGAGEDGTVGLPAAFVFALLEAVALAVHLQDMHMVGEPVQQSAGQTF